MCTGTKFVASCVFLAHNLSQASLRMSQSDDKALQGVEDVTDIIDLYESLKYTFYSKRPSELSESSKKLYQKTTTLFKNILAFQAAAANFLSKRTLSRAARAVVGWDDWPNMLEAIQKSVCICRDLQQAEAHSDMKTFGEIIKEIRADIKYQTAIWRKERELAEEDEIMAWLLDEDVKSHLEKTLNYLKNNPLEEATEITQGYEAPADWFQSAIQTWLGDSAGGNVFWLHGRCE